MITFHVLGALDLQGPDGRHLGSPLSGSKRLALLAYLALARGRGLQRRDTLLGLFWPELDQKHARNSLSNMLHQIRRSLGADVVVTRGHHEVGVAEGAVRCDALMFQEALDGGRAAEALELYRGDLLEGFFVPDASPEFDHWVDSERARLRRRAAEAARGLVEQAEQAGRTAEAIGWARKASTIDPYDEPAARRLMVLLDRAGDRAGALRTYEAFAGRLAREFEAEPSAETRVVIQDVRQRSSRHEVDEGPGEQPVRAIAVLPFENLSGSEDTEPFAAGLHGDLLTELSRISALTVIARTSMLRYRGTSKPAPEIARELGVGTVVEGAVQSAGGRLRLNVQVIDAESGSNRWAERYDRELTVDNLFDLQGELARKIARAVRAKLTPAERERGGREPTGNLEAYRLYAQGRAFLDQRTESGMRCSLGYFERAVELDPDYALAWVGLADALALLHDYGYEAAGRSLPRAEEAVHRALRLDPVLAESHASLGLLHSSRREGAAAIRELRRAVQLRPSYAEAHNWLSWNSLVLGYPGEALESATRAVELDPLSPEAVSNLSWSYLVTGEPEAALREARRVCELSPEWTSGPFLEALALYHLGRHRKAMSLLRDLRVEWAGSGPTATLALASAASGDHAQARALMLELESAGEPFSAALIELALGENERAFELFAAVDRWDYWSALSLHHFFPDLLAPLRADPLYDRMRRDMDRRWGNAPRDLQGAPRTMVPPQPTA